MKVNIGEMFLFFDEMMSPTDEERHIYWLKTTRTDGLIITFIFSIFEASVDVIIRNTAKVDIAGVSLENCSEIRVLDEERKCLEVLCGDGKGRCFLSLLHGPILDYKNSD